MRWLRRLKKLEINLSYCLRHRGSRKVEAQKSRWRRWVSPDMPAPNAAAWPNAGKSLEPSARQIFGGATTFRSSLVAFAPVQKSSTFMQTLTRLWEFSDISWSTCDAKVYFHLSGEAVTIMAYSGITERKMLPHSKADGALVMLWPGMRHKRGVIS